MVESHLGPQTDIVQHCDLRQWFSSCFSEIFQGFHQGLIKISFRNIEYNFLNVLNILK